MSRTVRLRVALLASWWLTLTIAALAGAESSQSVSTPRPSGQLAAVASSADQAMEYWDVTAWFDSGERVLARFLVTNQGPGERTAAAVGHVVLADGSTMPFQWGRRQGSWTLGADGRHLEIGKATLDLTGPAIVVTVRSKKRGIDLRLAIERSNGEASAHDLASTYATAVVMPAPAGGELGLGGSAARGPLVGSGAVTHTWMDRAEGELLLRRDELFARDGDTSLYLSIRTLADGSRKPTLLAHRGGHSLSRDHDLTLTLDGATGPYPVASAWGATTAGVDVRATLGRELLRVNPLAILPQPFRFLLALGGRPQRVWADARVSLDLKAEEAAPALRAELRGIATTAFARPVR